MNTPLIQVNKPPSYPEAYAYLKQCAQTAWYSAEGPFVRQFEESFAKYVGVRYATATNSGTTALHLAMLALGIGKGDEVLVPASTIAACYFAVWYTGATAVPVDVDPETYTINPKEVEEKITKKTKAIMPVHLYGHPCAMDEIHALAKAYKLNIVEDAAEAHGAEYKGKRVGGLGDVGCFSFYGNKIVTCGEGGMLVTNSKAVFERARRIKDLYHSKTKRFVHDGIGYRYALSNPQAAIGLVSLKHIEESIRYKRAMAALYEKGLHAIPGVVLPVEKPWAKNVYWMYAIRIQEKKFGIHRDRLMQLLQQNYHIQTRTFFYAPRTAFKKLHLFQREHFPVAEQIEGEGMYLPSGLGNSQKDFAAGVHAIAEIHEQT